MENSKVRLIDVTGETENIFFRCLHDEIPEDPRAIAIRRSWYERNIENGLRAKLLILNDGRIGGLCQYIPIEHSHLVGEDLLAILCVWVHGYDHGVGNQQTQGYEEKDQPSHRPVYREPESPGTHFRRQTRSGHDHFPGLGRHSHTGDHLIDDVTAK